MKLELTQIFLAIPAPGGGEDPWGQRFRLYGLMIALGVLAALEMARRRWQAKGGDPEDMSSLALWVVPAGLIGARLYHVLTDNVVYRGHWFDNPWSSEPLDNSPLAIWKGGLGIPGGLLFGFLAGYIVAKRRGMRIPAVADAIAPGVPLAQAIGRLGNYFNQELFGRPTDLPWGLYVDPYNRPAEYMQYETFQPTFLYEGLWNIGLMFFLLWIDKKKVLRPGRLFILYIGGYFLGRLWVEALRSDEAKTIFLGLRINIWTSLVALLAVAILLAFIGVRRKPDDEFGPYMDGHTFHLERGIEPAPGTGDDESVADDGSAPAVDGSAEDQAESEADVAADVDAVADVETEPEPDVVADTGPEDGTDPEKEPAEPESR